MIDVNHEPNEIDEIDRKLLSALQARRAVRIRRAWGTRRPHRRGARRRVMRLEERGIIQIVGVTDPLKLGYRSMAMVGIVAQGDVEEIAAALNDLQNVVYVVIAAGQYDILAEVIAEDQAAMFEAINRDVRNVPGVLRIETFPYYSIRTHRFGWGAL